MGTDDGAGGRAAEAVRYYSFAVMMTAGARPDLRAEVLFRLARAVAEDARLRGQCRDLDPTAATRVRPWSLLTL